MVRLSSPAMKTVCAASDTAHDETSMGISKVLTSTISKHTTFSFFFCLFFLFTAAVQEKLDDLSLAKQVDVRLPPPSFSRYTAPTSRPARGLGDDGPRIRGSRDRRAGSMSRAARWSRPGRARRLLC